jgi:hypothetical protein
MLGPLQKRVVHDALRAFCGSSCRRTPRVDRPAAAPPANALRARTNVDPFEPRLYRSIVPRAGPAKTPVSPPNHHTFHIATLTSALARTRTHGIACGGGK